MDILFDEHNLNAMFECIGAREDVLLNELKPHLRAYLIALKQMVLDAKKVLSLEYSKREIDAVIEAGVPIIKVDPFTKIKYHDKKCIEEKSTNKASKMILK